MPYHIVFDVSQSGYRYWWFPATGLALAVFAALGMLIDKHLPFVPPKRKLPLSIPIGLLLLWSVIMFGETFQDYRKLKSALVSGHYETVTGTVTDFTAQPEGDHLPESFAVNRRRFSYSFATVTAGFNRSRSHGGPIHEGIKVRLAVVGDEIARVETAQ